MLLPLPLTMYARPCECQHKIEEDYLFAFTWRLRQAHGKQVFVCTVQLVQKQAQFARKTGAICTKSNVICTERSPLISKTRCHSAMCHIVQLHTVTQLRWGNRLGSKRGFWERNKVAVWHNIIKDIAVCLTLKYDAVCSRKTQKNLFFKTIFSLQRDINQSMQRDINQSSNFQF